MHYPCFCQKSANSNLSLQKLLHIVILKPIMIGVQCSKTEQIKTQIFNSCSKTVMLNSITQCKSTLKLMEANKSPNLQQLKWYSSAQFNHALLYSIPILTAMNNKPNLQHLMWYSNAEFKLVLCIAIQNRVSNYNPNLL